MINKFVKLIFSKTARNVYLVFGSNLTSAFLAFIFTIILVRVLSLSDFGYFSSVFSFMLLIMEIADLGIGNSLSRFLPTLENKKGKLLNFLKTGFIYQIAVALILGVSIFASSSFLADLFFHERRYVYLWQIASIGILAAILANFFQYALSARQQFWRASLVIGLGGIFRVMLLLAFLFFSLISLSNIMWTQVISFALVVVAGFALVGTNFLRAKANLNDFKNLVSFSFLLGLARSLTSLASRLDVLMLVSLTNTIEAGIYSTASRVISIYPLLAGSLMAVIAPKITLLNSKQELKIYMVKVVVATLGLISSIIILIIFAPSFMTILFGEKGQLAVDVFRLLLISMIFFVGSIPTVSLSVYYLKKPQILTVNSILQLIIVVPANFFLIPRLGRLGPAYTLIIAYAVTWVMTSFLSLYSLKKTLKLLKLKS